MSDPHGGKPFPKGVLYAAGALVLGSMVLTYVGQATGLGTVASPDVEAVEVLEVRFEDRENGDVMVRTTDGRELGVFPSGENGFARGVLRGLIRDRRLEDIGAQAPFELARWSDGRLSLSDPSTGREIELNAFGRTNAEQFVRLFAEPSE